MKTFFLAFLLVVAPLVFGEDVVKYAGTTVGSATFNYPTFSSGACTAASSAYPFVVFNYTFTTAGVHEVAVMAENSFKNSVRVYIYTAFNPSTPCAGNYISRDLDKQRSESGGPVIDDFINFNAGLYYFVVSGSTGGIFAINIFPSINYGMTLSTSPAWPRGYVDSYGECDTAESVGEGETHFANFSWTAPSTGYYDIQTYFANETITSWTVYATLYNGTIANLASLQDPCNDTATGAVLIDGIRSSAPVATLYYVWLVAGTTYTVIFSGASADQIGNYGVQVLETRVQWFYNSTYVQPSRSGSTCTASSSTSRAWASTVFTAEQRAYLIDTAALPSPFPYLDTYSFLYSGLNAGDGYNSGPVTCPTPTSLIISGDTGDVTPVYTFTTLGKNYTVVVSSYSASYSGSTQSAFALYLFTGNPIGSIPAAPTDPPAPSTSGNAATSGVSGVATSGVTTSATTATAAPTSAPTSAPTQAPSSSTTSSPIDTGAGSQVVVGAAFVAALLVAML